jgi:hypothetical protein
MPWGHHWEAMYDAFWEGPTQDRAFSSVASGNEVNGCRVIGQPLGAPVTVRWRGGAQPRRFVRCDLTLSVVPESFVTDCQFIRCRFKGSVWEGVRFSKCHFEQCDFSETTIKKCHFVNTCTFQRNTASPQTFRIEETAISANAFIRGLHPNLDDETPGLIEYSKFKFVATRQKIAKAVFSATRNEPDVDYYFEAYEQLTRCTLDERVERYRFNDTTKQPTATRTFWLFSTAARVDRRAVLLSGWITNWGKSIFWPLLAFLILVGVFATFYLATTFHSGAPLLHELLKSLATATNISLVVGYTAEFRRDLPHLIKIIMLVNVVAGLAWYSLVVPTMARRLFR